MLQVFPDHLNEIGTMMKCFTLSSHEMLLQAWIDPKPILFIGDENLRKVTLFRLGGCCSHQKVIVQIKSLRVFEMLDHSKSV